MANEEGLDETKVSNISLVATEICTNLLKHAQGGEVFLSRLSGRDAPGVEVLAIDRGPGMTDVAQCLTDGYSSANTPGTGLGAIARLSQEFDVYSEFHKGTVLMAQVGRKSKVGTKVGAVVKPIAGEDVAGDAWAFCEDEHGMTLMVADGLGHGLMAARASAEAVWPFDAVVNLPRLRPWREFMAHFGAPGGQRWVRTWNVRALLRYAGIGNIAGVIVKPGKPAVMVSHNGTAGFHAPRFQEFAYHLPTEALIIMHSDGLATNWNTGKLSGTSRQASFCNCRGVVS